MARNSSRVFRSRSMVKQLKTALGPKLGELYWHTICHWVSNKGPEWTAKRLKALWNCALLARSGQLEEIPKVCLDSRIACGGNMLPKGIEGVLVHQWAHTQKPSKLRRLAAGLRAYTAIRLTNESTGQVSKAKTSITTPGNGVAGKILRITPCLQRSDGSIRPCTCLDRDTNKWRVDPLLKYYQEDMILLPPNRFNAKRVEEIIHLDKIQKLSGTSSYPNLFQIPGKDLRETPYLSLCASLLTKGKVPEALVNKLGDFSIRRNAEIVQNSAGDPTYGRINLIQEAGAKGRVVCSPNAWVQYYCYPYHSYLIQLVANLERGRGYQLGKSCALDQVRGVYTAINRLTNGSFCMGVDLSSATDRFPLEMQQLMCEYLGIPEFGAALEELKGPYKGLDGELWSYGAGQPMGLYGSFPLFHLTHYSLLNGLSYRLGLTGSDNFCVLGDDVLIFDEKLLGLYLKTLEMFGVPVSWNKSFKGNLVEFAGFVITKSRDTWTAFRPYKYGNHGDMSSVLNVLHSFGVKTSKWSNYWAKAYQAYIATLGRRCLDLSPIVPEERSIRKDDSLPGYGEIGSVLNRASYYATTSPDLPLDWIPDAWTEDRYALCQTQISKWDHFYEGEAVPTDRIIDSNTYNKELYAQEDKRRKSIYQSLWSDPLIKEWEATEAAF